MTRPTYHPAWCNRQQVFGDYVADNRTVSDRMLQHLTDLPWLQVTLARKEYFMSDTPRTYSYGTPPHDREYTSNPFTEPVLVLMKWLCVELGAQFNVCFLNRYDDYRHQLGWHADDSPSMDRNHPIAVVSFGSEREIWWKLRGESGIVPQEQRQLLGHGSLFVMPSGFQDTHLHRIPRADHTVGMRISLTFRRYV